MSCFVNLEKRKVIEGIEKMEHRVGFFVDGNIKLGIIKLLNEIEKSITRHHFS